MEISEEQYKKIEPYMPLQRGNVSINNVRLINAILYITENGCIGRSRGCLTTKIHMVTATDQSAVCFSLSAGQVHDAPEGEALLGKMDRRNEQKYLLMDKAYEGERMRKAAIEKSFVPIVPPKSNRKNQWKYDRQRYKQRNEIERYFLRLKRCAALFILL